MNPPLKENNSLDMGTEHWDTGRKYMLNFMEENLWTKIAFLYLQSVLPMKTDEPLNNGQWLLS